MCKCVNVEMGSYDNQMWVHAPIHMPKENGYCIDRCIAEEVFNLWMNGITTTGCCCGHNLKTGYIGVADKDIQTMKDLGYEVAPNENRPGDEDSFIPKSIIPLPLKTSGYVKIPYICLECETDELHDSMEPLHRTCECGGRMEVHYQDNFEQDHEEGTPFQMEVYGYFQKLGDGKGGEQICFVANNCDVSRIGELVNAGGITTESILGRRVVISIQDEDLA